MTKIMIERYDWRWWLAVAARCHEARDLRGWGIALANAIGMASR